MPLFDYIARDAQDQRQQGQVDAPDEAAARLLLDAQGLSPVELKVAASWSHPVMVRPPLPLLANLRALSEEVPSRRVRIAVQELADRLERGDAVPVAFASVQQRLPAPLRTLLELGLQRGRLDQLLTGYLDHVRCVSDIRAAVWASLAYPIVLLVACALLMIPIVLTLLPAFDRIYTDFNTELPAATTWMLATAQFLRDNIISLLLTVFVVVATLWFTLRLGGRSLPQQLFRRIPHIGTVYRWASLSSCAETMAMLVELGTALPQAFRTSAALTDDYALADGLRRSAVLLEEGRTDFLADPQLPAEMRAILRWRNDSSVMTDALRATGEIFAARARVELHIMRWLIEPAFVFLLAAGIGGAVIALFLPLVRLLNSLS